MIQDFSGAVKAGWRDALTIAEKLGNRGAGTLFGSRDCLLCLDNAGMRPLCEPCERLVPRAGMACPGCARPLAVPGLCGRCLRRPGPVDRLVAAFDYRFPLDRLVHRFKFGGDLAVGEFLGAALSQSVTSSPKPDLVLPSPASTARLRERGFNPAAVLAKRVARELGVSWHPGLLRKVKHTPPQTGLARTARRRNLRAAFRCEGVEGLRVAMVDDVTTTGATLEALALELRRAGASRVEGWVVARTPPPGKAP
jgi:ComF family protein